MATLSDIYGRLENITRVDGRWPLIPPHAGRNPYPDRSIIARTQQQYDMIRMLSMFCAEIDPNVSGIVRALVNYIIGTGIATSVQPEHQPFDDWMKREKINLLYYRESVERYITQGEVFIRRFNRPEGPVLRFVEPDAIRPPPGEDHEGEWSFGVKTEPNDTATHLAYYVWYDPNKGEKGEEVPADEMYQLKNAFMNQKRGISILYPIVEEANAARDHRRIARDGDKIRQSIPYFREHAKADKEAVTKFQADLKKEQQDKINLSADGLYDRFADGGSVPNESASPIDVPETLTVRDPPQNRGTKDTTVGLLVKAYEAIAASINCPYYLASGDTTGTNFATSLVSESPWTKTIEALQGLIGGYWQEIHQACVNTLDEIGRNGAHTVTTTCSSPVSRNTLDEAKRNQILSDYGILSDLTWTGQADLIHDVEQEAIAQQPDKKKPEEPDAVVGEPQEPRVEDLE